MSLLAGDADRERVAQELQAHHLAGRLDAAELEERVGRVYAARTFADLELLTADLPTTRPAPRERPPAARQTAGGFGLLTFSQVHDLDVSPEQAYAEALDLVQGAMAGFGYLLEADDPPRALTFVRSERPGWVPLVIVFLFPFGLFALTYKRRTRIRIAFLPQPGGRCRMRISGEARRPVRKAFLQLSAG